MGPQRMYRMTRWVRRLLVANLLVFLIQKTLLVDPSFLKAFGFEPLFAWVRPWTFVTYMFLHVNMPHLVFNMLALFMFGPSVEDKMGGRMFLLFYLLCGLGGAALSFLLMQWVPVGLILGASGAILGVTVAFAWYWPNHQVFVFPLPDPIPAKWLVTFLVGFDLVLAWAGALTRSGVSDGVAHLAVGQGALGHLGLDHAAAARQPARRRPPVGAAHQGARRHRPPGECRDRSRPRQDHCEWRGEPDARRAEIPHRDQP